MRYFIPFLLFFCLLGSLLATEAPPAVVPLTNFRLQMGDSGDDYPAKMIQHGSGYFLAASITDPNDGIRRATIANLDINGNLIWVRRVETASIFYDLILSGSRIVLVGSTLSTDVALVDPLLAVVDLNGNFLITRTYETGRRGSFRKIINNPSPLSAAFPFYVTGQALNGGADEAFVFNVDDGGNVNFYNRYARGDLQIMSGFTVLPNGNMVLSGGFGNTAGDVLMIDNAGNRIIDRRYPMYTTGMHYDANGLGFLTGGSNFANNENTISYINPDWSMAYRYQFNGVTSMNLQAIHNGVAYATGRIQVGTEEKVVLMKLAFTANSLQLLSAVYLTDGNTIGLGITLLGAENIAYTASMDGLTSGFGGIDQVVGIMDTAFLSCPLEFVAIDIQETEVLQSGAVNVIRSVLDVPQPLSFDATIIDLASLFLCEPTTPTSCEEAQTTLNISTGTDGNGGLAALGLPDPFWNLINLPPTVSALDASIMVPNMYVIPPYGTSPWNIITGTGPASQILNVRPTAAFGNNNADRNQPWRIRRSFCLCEDTEITITGNLRADDIGKLFLYDDTPLSPFIGLVGSTNFWQNINNFYQNWPINYSQFLTAGTYHLEFEVLNTGASLMGFNVSALISTASGRPLLINSSAEGCMRGNITINKLHDADCDEERSPGDRGVPNYTFTATEQTTGMSYTGQTNAFGEMILRQLPYGTYDITEASTPPWVPTNPASGTQTVTISPSNPIAVVDFLNKNPELCACIEANVFPIDSDEGACCYELLLDNDYGPYYDRIALVGNGITPSLLAATATWGTVSTSGDTIFVDGVVPQATNQSTLQFCVEDLNGTGSVQVLWYFEATIVCEESVEVECPVTCSLEATNTGEDECCPVISYTRFGNERVFAAQVRTLNGVTFDNSSVVLAPGLATPSYSSTSRTITDLTFGELPASVNDMISFCFSDVTTFPQYVVVDFFDETFQNIICSDTLTYECPVTNPCLNLDRETASLNCAEDGYRLSLVFSNPPGGTFEDIGYVKVNITGPAGFEQQIDYFPNPVIGSGDLFLIDTVLQTPLDMYGDTLCITISAHNGPDERLCCFVDEICLPFPLCDPCPFVDAYLEVNPEDSCCYTLFVDDLVPINPYFDSLTIELINGPNPTLGSSNIITNFQWSGTEIIPGSLYGYNYQGTSGGVVGTAILDFCVTPDFSPDSTYLKVTWYNTELQITCMDTVAAICQLEDPCPEIESYLVPLPVGENDDQCCFDVFVTNNYTANPTIFQSITVDLLAPATTYGGVNILPFPAGWNPTTTNVAGQSYTFTHPSGSIPVAANTKLFQFCLDKSFSTDSTNIEVSWMTSMDTICRDTLAAHCPGCLTVQTDTLICQGNGDYTYLFNFTNYSNFPVNTVAIINTDPATPGLVQEEYISLGVTVPVGGVYTGFLPVQLTGAPGDEVCFDVIMRYVLPDDDLNIECCYATVCTTLTACENDEGTCILEELIVQPTTCPVDTIEIVCGCDGNEYANACLAIQAGVIDYTIGSCENGNRAVVTLTGTLTDNGQAELNWNYLRTTTDVRFQELRQRPLGTTQWQRVTRNDQSRSVLGRNFRDPAFVSGTTEYQLVAVTESGLAIRSNTVTLQSLDNDNSLQLSLFPNPVTAMLFVSSNRTGSAELTLIGAAGTIQHQQAAEFSGAPVRVDVSRQLPGVYTVQLRYPDGSVGYQRFVKQ